jgi:hypothetical protein
MGPRPSSCLDKRVEQPHKFREDTMVRGFSHPPGPHSKVFLSDMSDMYVRY